MKVAIVGTGYVGLVSGVCLAAKGHDVTNVDINPLIVERLNRGEPTIHENGLPELLESVVAAGRFSATTDLSSALAHCELAIIAVGTPSDNGIIDLRYVRQVACQIGTYLGKSKQDLSVVIKSTVVPGTTSTVVRDEIEQASGLKHGAFGLGMNPEFLREGEAIEDFASPDRIVLGYEDEKTLERLERLYAPWDVDKVRVNTRTAELIKYANNAMLATQISAMNEIANLAAAVGGIDIRDVLDGISLDRRWNPILAEGQRANPTILSYLVPGCGFGGSCFPKDVEALRSQGEQLGLKMAMLNAVLEVNEAQPRQVTDILRQQTGSLEGKTVVLLGLAFKPGTDDVRESASLKIARDLLDQGVLLKIHDPIASPMFVDAMAGPDGRMQIAETWQDQVALADVVVIATAWPTYRDLTSLDVTGKMIFDCRRMFKPSQFPAATYLSIGLGA